jgi:hypothetical protein
MSALVLFTLAFAAIRLQAMPGPVLDCYGGDGGPSPFVDISGSLVESIRPIRTGGPVEDFLHLKRRDELLSRGVDGDIRKTPLSTNEPRRISHTDMPLSRIVHPRERYLATEGSTWLLDLVTGSWKHFEGPAGPLEHLFWYAPPGEREASLFSLGAAIRPSPELLSYRLYQLDPRGSRVSSCSIDLSSQFRVVKGMTQPYVVFFKDEPLGREGRQITFRLYYTRGVGACPLAQEGTLRLPDVAFDISLEGAYYFSKLHAAALKFDNARKNLVWVNWGELKSRHDGCQFYQVESSSPVFLSEKEPVMASWSSRGGVQLYYLEKKKTARVLSSIPFEEGDSRSLWLTEDGRKLFAAISGRSGRKVIELSLRTNSP